MNPATAALILKLIDVLAAGITMAPVILAQYRATKAKIETMVAEGRDPTAEEHAAIDAELDVLIAHFMTPIDGGPAPA